VKSRDPKILEAARILRQSKQVLAVCHVGPDVDAIGSLLALGLLLDSMGVGSVLVSEDGVPHEARFLPGSDSIVRCADADPDLIVVLDCSTLSRTGSVVSSLPRRPILNVDHHITNDHFGDWDVVDPTMAATTQLVLRLAVCLGLSVSRDLATCILAGLVGDTQGFRTLSADEVALKDTLMLLAAGANLYSVVNGVFGSRPREHLCLWGRVLSDARVEGRVVWACIPLQVRELCGLSDDDDAGLVEFLLGTEGTMAAAVFSEKKDGTVDVSLRSISGVDVAQVAHEFGGGGHTQAAGCTLRGKLGQVCHEVLFRLRQETGPETIRSAAS